MATEKRLIRGDTIEERLRDLAERYYGSFSGDAYASVAEAIAKMPTVDAVEVVRCNDCENWMYEYDDVGLCVTDVPDIDGVQRHAYDFCSYGERKGNEKR